MDNLLLVIALLSLLVIPAAASPNGWTEPPLSASPPARYGHTMVNLNGEIHIFGGRTGDAQTAGSEPMGMVLNDLWRLNRVQSPLSPWPNISARSHF